MSVSNSARRSRDATGIDHIRQEFCPNRVGPMPRHSSDLKLAPLKNGAGIVSRLTLDFPGSRFPMKTI
jgi:hypothetical protein